MADNVLLSLEGLGTDFAGEQPLAAVDVLLVDLQVAAVSEGLLADLTAMDDVCFHSMVRTGGESSQRLDKPLLLNAAELQELWAVLAG